MTGRPRLLRTCTSLPNGDVNDDFEAPDDVNVLAPSDDVSDCEGDPCRLSGSGAHSQASEAISIAPVRPTRSGFFRRCVEPGPIDQE